MLLSLIDDDWHHQRLGHRHPLVGQGSLFILLASYDFIIKTQALFVNLCGLINNVFLRLLSSQVDVTRFKVFSVTGSFIKYLVNLIEDHFFANPTFVTLS